jgi:hypothetical protein
VVREVHEVAKPHPMTTQDRSGVDDRNVPLLAEFDYTGSCGSLKCNKHSSRRARRELTPGRQHRAVFGHRRVREPYRVSDEHWLSAIVVDSRH